MMRSFRTIIVDKDVTARENLVKMLREQSEIQIIAQCESSPVAIRLIQDEQPDLLFLEVEMPNISGFEILQHVSEHSRPAVIFMSSQAEFAARAFEFEALDYLQKPVHADRLEKSLQKLSNHNSRREVGTQERLGNLLEEVQTNDILERFIIKQSGEYHLVRAEHIIWIEADGNYSKILTTHKKFMIRYTLSGFEEQLDSSKFFRISRSQIVNVDYVVKIKDHLYGNYTIELENGTSIKMSKNYKRLLDTLKNF